LLAGIRVLDLASVGPAARASRWLADYGAEVVKVGPVPADGAVQITPPFHAYSAGRGFRRILVDLKSPAGVDTFLRLADGADVVIESYRPGVVDRLGIGPATVTTRNPGIVYCSTSGFGQTGPRARWAGHDLNYLAVSGFLASSSPRGDGTPPVPGTTVADSAAGGMHAVMSILAALVQRSATGAGAHLDVSIADGALALMSLAADEHLATGATMGVGSTITTARYACYDTYGTADGRSVAVAAIEPKFWANLCKLVGLEGWITHQLDDDVQDAVRADLRATFATKTRDEWVELLAAHDTCVSPVLTVEEATADEQYAARGAFVTAAHPDHGRFGQVGPVLAGMPTVDGDIPVRDASETDLDAVLAAAGFNAEEITALRAAGTVA
jgi:alpha-methylacyl-CoA racemase